MENRSDRLLENLAPAVAHNAVWPIEEQKCEYTHQGAAYARRRIYECIRTYHFLLDYWAGPYTSETKSPDKSAEGGFLSVS